MEDSKVRPRYPNRIAELREARGWTQRQLATLLGLTFPTVNRHEKGNRSLDGHTIEAYAKLFGVSAYELFVDPSTIAPDYPDDDRVVDESTITELTYG